VLRFRTIVAVVALCAGAPSFAIFAQTDGTEEQRLKAVEDELKATEAEKTRLQALQESATRELATIRNAMIAMAADVQTQEASLSEFESKLSALESEESALKAKLGVRDEQMQRVAMALQRMALRPTDAVTLSPLQPDDAVRTAILLRATIPEVQVSARALEGDLALLYQVRGEIEGQQQKIASAAAGLIDKRRALEAREQDKLKLQMQFTTASSEAIAKSQRLADEARDLKDLVSKVLAARALEAKKQADAAKAAAAKAAAEQANARVVLKPPPGVTKPPAPQSQTASAPANTPTKATPTDLRPFSQARGTMPFPAQGTLKRRYGDASDEPAALSKGIVIAARNGGQVVAPFDGVVAFAGPFRGYGLLLIIEHSEGYHTLLSGLGRIDCVLDQRVFAGEPVGTMNTESSADLYVELRQNGQPVNPLPWLVSRTAGKSNG
jgi:septal ring factor EnvC (AmiA/AmiB activator)